MKYLIPLLLLLISCTERIEYDRHIETEEDIAIVLSTGELEEFNEAGAIAGYVAGRALFGGNSAGMVGGFLGSQTGRDCKIPVRIRGKGHLITTSSELLCKTTIVGDTLAVTKVISYRTHPVTKDTSLFIEGNWQINRR